jgi:hypothetical protein
VLASATSCSRQACAWPLAGAIAALLRASPARPMRHIEKIVMPVAISEILGDVKPQR